MMTVQDKINEVAEKKLDKEIDRFLRAFHNHHFFNAFKDLRLQAGNKTLDSALYPGDIAHDLIKKQFLDSYIKAESDKFYDVVVNGKEY